MAYRRVVGGFRPPSSAVALGAAWAWKRFGTRGLRLPLPSGAFAGARGGAGLLRRDDVVLAATGANAAPSAPHGAAAPEGSSPSRRPAPRLDGPARSHLA